MEEDPSYSYEISKKEKRRQDLLDRLEKLQTEFEENKEKSVSSGDGSRGEGLTRRFGRIFTEKLGGFKREIKELQEGDYPFVFGFPMAGTGSNAGPEQERTPSSGKR